MATEVHIGGDGTFFVGEDKILALEVVDASSVPVDMTGWSVHWYVRVSDAAPGDPLLEKTAVITGDYNADRATNTQRAVVTLSDDETTSFVSSRAYRHSWKRIDPGNETVLAYGAFRVQIATAR